MFATEHTEGTQQAVPQQPQSAAATDKFFEIMKDGSVHLLNEHVFSGRIQTGIVTLGGDALLKVLKDSHKGN
ncbi:hypothetical protein [Bacillus cereus]|uniref:hypothetical protein n=1 Tax=Bacillus cereus TaxID=1396 RepID=UPI0018F4335F|nr:hypothetical protein [Bacillus cereus]MBJ8025933.1 hypothetical protein [Bacillus cereus]MBJ8038223.1 hypothetical protein [Bacillus cereus]